MCIRDRHVSIAKAADVVMIAPASANVIAKLAHGLADDMLTTTVLACRCKKIIAPAMNTNMYENPIVQDNLKVCERYGMEAVSYTHLLEPEEESRMIGMLSGEEDQKARAALIEHNLRLVVYIAKKFDNTSVGVEDLISIGTIGLIKAINTFKPDKNIKLATYASRCIENEILMYLRRNNKTRMEVSIDEPLNVDWDGNELLLSDILGTDEDVIYHDIEDEIEKNLLNNACLLYTSRCV